MTIGDLSTLLVWGAATAFTVALVAYSVDLARLADRAQKRVAEAALVGAASERVAAGPAGRRLGRRRTRAGTRVGPRRGHRRGSTTLARARAAPRRRSSLRGIAAGRVAVGQHVRVHARRRVRRRRRRSWRRAAPPRHARSSASFVIGHRRAGARPRAQRVLHPGRRGRSPPCRATGWSSTSASRSPRPASSPSRSPRVSVLQLLRDLAATTRLAVAVGRRRALAARLEVRLARAGPGRASSRRCRFRLNAVAFVLWTFTLIGGAIWAEHAWGRYWGWDPKEVWTLRRVGRLRGLPARAHHARLERPAGGVVRVRRLRVRARSTSRS